MADEESSSDVPLSSRRNTRPAIRSNEANEANEAITIFDSRLPKEANERSQVRVHLITGPVSSGGGSVFLGSQSAQGNIINNFSPSRRPQVLRWLSKVPYALHHKAMCQDLLEDSGAWLFRNSKYVTWENSPESGILWLHGIPGSGKSKLVSVLINRLLELQRSRTPAIPLAYFYISRTGGLERTDPNHIMSALLKQMAIVSADKSIKTPVMRAWEGRHEEAEEMGISEPAELQIGEATVLLLELLETEPLTIVIDALDECDPARRHELLEALDILIQRSSNMLKVFVSSRDDNDIVCRLSITPNVIINARDNHYDITRFVRREVDKAILNKRLLSGKVSRQLRHDIITTLTLKARTMFKWVSLQLENLCDHQRIKHEADVRGELETVPLELFQFYDRTYHSILQSGRRSRTFAIRAFQWLLFAQRPLTGDEMCAVISFCDTGTSVTISPQQLLDVCCNLVVINQQPDEVQFAHLSVQEYFETRKEISGSDARISIANDCIDAYADFLAFRHLGSHVPSYSRLIYLYASEYWAAHVATIEFGDGETKHKEKAKSFVTELFRGTEIDPRAIAQRYAVAVPSYRTLPGLRNNADAGQKLALKGLSTYLPQTKPASEKHDVCWVINKSSLPLPAGADPDPNSGSCSRFAERITHQLVWEVCQWTGLENSHLTSLHFLMPISKRVSLEGNLRQVVRKLRGSGLVRRFRGFVMLPLVVLYSLQWGQRMDPNTSEPRSPRCSWDPRRTLRFLDDIETVVLGSDVSWFQVQELWMRNWKLQHWPRLNRHTSASNAGTPRISSHSRGFKHVLTVLQRLIDHTNEIEQCLGQFAITFAEDRSTFDELMGKFCPDLISSTFSEDADPALNAMRGATVCWLQSIYTLLWSRFHYAEGSQGRTRLSVLAEAGDLTAIYSEIKEGTEQTNQFDFRGRTPLSYAAGAGHDRVVRALISEYHFSSEIDVNLKDNDGHSPMWWALTGGHETAAWILIGLRELCESDRKLFWDHAREWAIRERLVRFCYQTLHPCPSPWLMSTSIERHGKPRKIP